MKTQAELLSKLDDLESLMLDLRELITEGTWHSYEQACLDADDLSSEFRKLSLACDDLAFLEGRSQAEVGE